MLEQAFLRRLGGLAAPDSKGRSEASEEKLRDAEHRGNRSHADHERLPEEVALELLTLAMQCQALGMDLGGFGHELGTLSLELGSASSLAMFALSCRRSSSLSSSAVIIR
jgi:hypothetical protein